MPVSLSYYPGVHSDSHVLQQALTQRMTNAFLLGLDHTTQHLDDGGRLEAIIRGLCQKHDFDLIAEEWGTEEPTSIVETVARKVSVSVSIDWLNIEMCDAMKEELGILAVLRLRTHPRFTMEGPVYETPEATYFPHADGLREEYWLSKLQAAQAKCPLVICGLIHVRPFSKRLEDVGFVVETSLLCDHAWYRSKPDSKCAEVEKNLRDDRY